MSSHSSGALSWVKIFRESHRVDGECALNGREVVENTETLIRIKKRTVK